MRVAWSLLRNPEPTALAAARMLAHRAVQWPARAALANLAPAPDDSHASLAWDPAMAALFGQPLPGGARVGLHVGVHELVFVKGERTEMFAMTGRPEREAGAWLDARLAAEGLKPATGARLHYEMPPALFARPAAEARNLATLSVWFAAGAELLQELRKKYRRRRPGPVRCWPHHFDIAFLVPLDGARSIGIGLSPGDEYYAQPYFYLSPYPKPDAGKLPPLPPGGRWHTRDFFGAVAPATDLFALRDPRAGLVEVLAVAFDESLRRLKG
jgi:hypothetical protein